MGFSRVPLGWVSSDKMGWVSTPRGKKTGSLVTSGRWLLHKKTWCVISRNVCMLKVVGLY